jgi:salicylate hydroxylase
MDHRWTPALVRETLLEVLDFCNSWFRPWYQQTACEIVRWSRLEPGAAVVELGAGGGAILREVARLESSALEIGYKLPALIPTDLYPALEEWRRMQAEFPQIQPCESPVDFDDPPFWPEDTLLVLAAALHHVPRPRRIALLLRLAQTARAVLIFEPVRRTALSLVLTSFCWVPALLLPAVWFRRQGVVRRVLLCWMLPVVPLMFVWDGIISCLREWSDAEWSDLSRQAATVDLNVIRTTSWQGEQIAIVRRGASG